jgi:O-antigen/teichoic acid export membrane protein
MASPLKKLVGQTAIYGLSSIVGRFLNYLLVPLYTGVFITSDYGTVTELFAYAGLLMVLLTYGMETAYFRFAEKHDDPEKIFSSTLLPILITSLLFILFVILFSGSIADILEYSEHSEYIVWFALILGFDSMASIPFAKLRRENKALRFAVYKFINIGLNIGFNLFFLLVCPSMIKHNPDSIVNSIYNEHTGIGYVFISNLIASAFTLILFLPVFLKIKFKVSFDLLKQLLNYGFPLMFVGLAGMINEVLDRILLKYLIVPPEGVSDAHQYAMSQLGIYGANVKMAVLIVLFIQAFRYAAEPFFFSREKHADAKQTYASVMKYFVIFGLTVFLMIMLYIDLFKHFMTGREYWEGLNIVPILLLANIMLGVIYNLSIWYKLSGKTGYGAYIALIGASVTIIINIVFIPIIGYLGSAWGHFASYFTMMILTYFLGRKHYRIDYPLKDIFVYVVLALVLYFVSVYHPFEGIYKYTINTCLFLIFTGYVEIKEKLIRRSLKIDKITE